MEIIGTVVATLGIPTAITGILGWYLKRRIDRQEEQQLERERNQEQLILMMMQSTRANNVGIEAIARAIQRIPDAHCNGDMTAALDKMKAHQAEEKDFLMKLGVKHIFDT